MRPYPILLSPACRSAIWGGNRIRAFGKTLDAPNLAESWELSCHPNGLATVAEGALSGKTLPEAIEALGAECLGARGGVKPFPLLIKLLDADRDLSIQVHPDDAYAREHEGEWGKTELWVILHAEPGARLLCGFSRAVTRDEIARRVADCTLPEVLGVLPVKPGDCVLIPAGTVHAIGGGILLAEIQQSSDATYRLYDYGRLDTDGKPRALHLAKALDVVDIAPPPPVRDPAPDANGVAVVADCPRFRVERWTGERRVYPGDPGSFTALLFLEGHGTLTANGCTAEFAPGRMFFLSANLGETVIEGAHTALATTAGSAEAAR